MTLEPGGLRELHWHANAAEWAYVIEGRCRVTTIDPENQCEIVDFGPGDVWYFPRGFARCAAADLCYQLLAQKPDAFAGGTMRTVSAAELPISTTITGALLIIEPGALRELHWHPNAAEWQFYLKGSGRMTVFGSH